MAVLLFSSRLVLSFLVIRFLVRLRLRLRLRLVPTPLADPIGSDRYRQLFAAVQYSTVHRVANRYTASHFSRSKQLTWRYAPYALTGRTPVARKSDSHRHSEYLRILKSPKKLSLIHI